MKARKQINAAPTFVFLSQFTTILNRISGTVVSTELAKKIFTGAQFSPHLKRSVKDYYLDSIDF